MASSMSGEDCAIAKRRKLFPSNYSYVTFVVTMRLAMTTKLLNCQLDIDNMMNDLIMVYILKESLQIR